jgi:hypothetical protein
MRLRARWARVHGDVELVDARDRVADPRAPRTPLGALIVRLFRAARVRVRVCAVARRHYPRGDFHLARAPAEAGWRHGAHRRVGRTRGRVALRVGCGGRAAALAEHGRLRELTFDGRGRAAARGRVLRGWRQGESTLRVNRLF